MSGPVKMDRPPVVLSGGDDFASVGFAKVGVIYRGGTARVGIIGPCPWGWGNVEREFLNPDSPGAMAYAHKLLARLAAEALAADAYNGKRKLRLAIGREMGRLAGFGTPRQKGRR